MNVSNEIITASIAFFSVVASSVISFFISKKAAETEINKLKLAWEYDITQKKNQDFEKMVADISKLLFHPDMYTTQEALNSVSVVRAQLTGSEAEAIDMLYYVITTGDKSEIQSALDRAIEQKRQCAC